MSPSREEHERWLELLRQRFVEIAGRRLAPDAVEDTVQEALRIVYQKGLGPAEQSAPELPSLAWCFQVLRNCIGNHYQWRRHRRHEPLDGAAASAREQRESGADPLEALEASELRRHLEAALGALARESADCARYLRRVLAGDAPAALADREGLDAAVLYRRLYRCRARLKTILLDRGVRP
ncbi:MAG: hypothetical protein H6694_05265 [Candidatus Latescibacteria bacterium]|nr:hypothetical protein [Candidatus Latescibacterota bacterium]